MENMSFRRIVDIYRLLNEPFMACNIGAAYVAGGKGGGQRWFRPSLFACVGEISVRFRVDVFSQVR